MSCVVCVACMIEAETGLCLVVVAAGFHVQVHILFPSI